MDRGFDQPLHSQNTSKSAEPCKIKQDVSLKYIYLLAYLSVFEEVQSNLYILKFVETHTPFLTGLGRKDRGKFKLDEIMTKKNDLQSSYL